MANLYELTGAFKDAEYYFNNAETEDELLQAEQYLIAAEVDLAEKAENIAKLIKNIEAEGEIFKKESDRLSKVAKSKERQVNSLKKYLKENLEIAGVDKIKGELLTVALQNSPKKLEVDSVKNIPKEFMSQPDPIVRSKDLLEHLINTGEYIEGVSVVQNKHVRIR